VTFLCQANRSVQLIHFAPDSRYALAIRGSYAEGSANAARSHEDVHHARIYTFSASPTEGSRKSFPNGDELAKVGEKLPMLTQQIL